MNKTLSDDQASQFSWLFRLFMNQYIKAHRLYQEGVVTESEWENYARTGAFFFNSPGGTLFLEGHRGVFEDVMDIFRAIPTTESTMDLSLCRTKKIEK